MSEKAEIRERMVMEIGAKVVDMGLNIRDPIAAKETKVIFNSGMNKTSLRGGKDIIVGFKLDKTAFTTAGRRIGSKRAFAVSNERAAKIEENIVTAGIGKGDRE